MSANHLRALFVALCLGSASQVFAHGDEDHGAPSTSTPLSADTLQRLPDGRVLLPKQAQQRLGIRTLVASESSAARSIELNGHVVMDPNLGGRVQASSGGRISAPAEGLPLLGSPVRKGQILAWVKPAVSAYERALQQADLADSRSKLKLAEQNLARLKQLTGSIAAKDLHAGEAELAAWRGRTAALATVAGGEALRAPVSGVLAASNVVSGQVVESSSVLFEILDPKGLLIEAQAYDPALLNNLASASLLGGSLRYVGGASALRDGALVLLFAPEGPLPLALGQNVKLIAQTREQIKGVRLPASSVVKNAANESVVWLHEQAQIFRAVPVQPLPLDGNTVLVSQIKPGSRVVTQGATLINQIR
jgi:cobalt-zinc-cadmium efflux system membrane fusion protein